MDLVRVLFYIRVTFINIEDKTLTIKTGFSVESVKKCIYCGLSNTVVYVKDIIIRYN